MKNKKRKDKEDINPLIKCDKETINEDINIFSHWNEDLIDYDNISPFFKGDD